MNEITAVILTNRDGYIGQAGRLPIIKDLERADRAIDWMSSGAHGGLSIVGSQTARLMQAYGADVGAMIARRELAIWSRSYGLTPEEFAKQARSISPVCIHGGCTTFQTFLPFCDSISLRIEDLTYDPSAGEPHYLPAFLRTLNSSATKASTAGVRLS